MYSEWYRSFCGPQLHSYVFSLEEAGILSSRLCNLNDSVNVTPPVLRESKNPLCSVFVGSSCQFRVSLYSDVCVSSTFVFLLSDPFSEHFKAVSNTDTSMMGTDTSLQWCSWNWDLKQKNNQGWRRFISVSQAFFLKGIRFVPVCRKDTKHVKITCNDVGTPITASTSSSSFSNADSSNVPDLTVSLSSRFSSLHCISLVNFHLCLFCFAHHQHLEVSQMI